MVSDWKYLIEPIVKKVDGAWHLHGKNLRVFTNFEESLTGNGIQILISTMKKGKLCGVQKNWKFLLTPPAGAQNSDQLQKNALEYHQKHFKGDLDRLEFKVVSKLDIRGRLAFDTHSEQCSIYKNA